MLYFMLVIAIFCLAIVEALLAYANVRHFWVVALIDFVVTFATVFAVGMWVATQSATTSQVFWTSIGIAVVFSGGLLLVRMIDKLSHRTRYDQASRGT
jgi:hypothetical protein